MLFCEEKKSSKGVMQLATKLAETSFFGMTGFEPATLCSQSKCATKLRYIPFLSTTLSLFYKIISRTASEYTSMRSRA